MTGFSSKLLATIATFGVAAGISTVAQAGSTTINFADYANTYLASADGVSFSLAPGYAVNGYGPPPYTVPYVNAFGDPNQIANSGNFGEYPTSETLTFTFSSPASGISFFFNNYGTSYSGRGATLYYAYNASDTLITDAFIGDTNGATVVVPASGIKWLVLDNGTGDPTGDSNSWLFGVGSLTFSTVPEPSTWAMLLLGFAGLGFAGYRKAKASAVFAA
jgi:PEP-CTERM motif